MSRRHQVLHIICRGVIACSKLALINEAETELFDLHAGSMEEMFQTMSSNFFSSLEAYTGRIPHILSDNAGAASSGITATADRKKVGNLLVQDATSKGFLTVDEFLGDLPSEGDLTAAVRAWQESVDEVATLGMRGEDIAQAQMILFLEKLEKAG